MQDINDLRSKMNKIFIYLIFGVCSVFGKKDDDLKSFDLVEKKFLEMSKKEAKYPGENFPVIVTETPSSLGKLAALHFINWIINNPTGVIALSTGKTPEFFIRQLNFYKDHWTEEKVQEELKQFGIDSPSFPNTSDLKFVQMYEYFPIDTQKSNSFTYFVNKYYLNLLQLKKENILSMEDSFLPILKKRGINEVFKEGKIDLQILTKDPMLLSDNLQQKAMKDIFTFCSNYEKKIKKWGGIGFFLVGIGPDGHIASNQSGCWHNCTTRLVKLNYMSAAASAKKFGGIENSIKKYAVTIGLDTFCINKNAEIIIMASGEPKGPIVARSIESGVSTDLPATAFQKMKGAKFYITQSTAKYLNNRKHLDYLDAKELPSSFIDDTLIEIALLKEKPIFKLTIKDLESTPSGIFLSKKIENNFKEAKIKTQKMLIEKLENKIKLKDKTSILHTSPHHDDIALAYYPFATQLIGNYENYFCTITSGFSSVTNSYLKEHLKEIKSHLKTIYKEIQEDYSSIFFLYKKAFKTKSTEKLRQIENCLIAKKISDIFKTSSSSELSEKLDFLTDYLNKSSPGDTDPVEIQSLKGAIRETEEERAWYVSGTPLNNLFHLRSNFYTANYSDSIPEKIDINPIVRLIEKIKPDIISLALDPEGAGPVTHFKSLQMISSAILSLNNPKLSIWGYRNICHKFSFSEATLFFLVSQDEIDTFNNIFTSCYSTQKLPSFPSPYFDGQFSNYATQIQKEQLKKLKILLGENFFKRHHDKSIKNAAGLILMKKLTLSDLSKYATDYTKKE